MTPLTPTGPTPPTRYGRSTVADCCVPAPWWLRATASRHLGIPRPVANGPVRDAAVWRAFAQDLNTHFLDVLSRTCWERDQTCLSRWTAVAH